MFSMIGLIGGLILRYGVLRFGALPTLNVAGFEFRRVAKQKEFNNVAQKMTEELCSRYGPLVQIWFDAGVKTPDQGGDAGVTEADGSVCGEADGSRVADIA